MADDLQAGPYRRMWTPWRLRYVAGERGSPDCLFCRIPASDDDVANLVLLRGARCFAMLNLYPYNTGHLMLVPYGHIQDPAQWDEATGREMAKLLPLLTGTIRHVMACDGLNVGMNLGEAAGAGIAEHLHQHVVPRWIGDANFMPIIGATKVLPELLPATYAKVRLELSARIHGSRTVAIVVLDRTRSRVLITDAGIPTITPGSEAIWRTTAAAANDLVGPADILGWGGADQVAANRTHRPAIVFGTVDAVEPGPGVRWSEPGDLDGDDQRAATTALARWAH